MDGLFAAATSFFRAGQFKAAADAYIALFEIFFLNEDGYHFTRPDPVEALHTDVGAMQENLFIAIGRGYPEAVAKAIEVSSNIYYYGPNRYALLDAWQEIAELRAALQEALIAHARQPISQEFYSLGHAHPADLLRELTRRYGDLTGYEALCRQVGPQQGWPYEDLINLCREQKDWKRVLDWAEDGLGKLPADSRLRSLLQERRGEALAHLDRPQEALDELRALFQRQRTVTVYLKLRKAARTTRQWQELYPQLTTEMQDFALAVARQQSHTVVDMGVAGLLGYAYLLEGDWPAAVQWALNPAIPPSWRDSDLALTVATGLLRMGLAARGERDDKALRQALDQAPQIIREQGHRLESVSVACNLPAASLLDSTVQLYEGLVERAIAYGKQKHRYSEAGAACQVIQAIRRIQGREADFQQYYRSLLNTYSRYSALKAELRKAVRS